MSEHSLNTPQVTVLLVGTSCGIGFLMGTGELAVHQGMAGCLYALATALGLAVLAFYAPMLRRSGQSIWSRFDQTYGPSVSRSVALLSLIWMTGVLATQIRGGSAVLVLTGMSDTAALLLMSSILLVLSMARLSWLSAGLGFCMLACGVMLGNTLIETAGLGIWLHAPVLFASALRHTALAHTGFSVATIVAMVICGADYQQFVIAANTPKTARNGCMLAAGCVFVGGFLPASAVIATHTLWHLDNVDNPVQIIPMLLIHSLPDNISPGLVIATLIAAAIGAGCAILRAMSDALTATQPRLFQHRIWSRVLPVVLSSFVASRGQSLIDMMIELNMVYLAAVGPLLLLRLLHVHLSDAAASASLAAGCSIALTCYLISWTGIAVLPGGTTALLSLCFALAIAGVMHLRAISFTDSSGRISPASRLMLSPGRRWLRSLHRVAPEPESGGRDS
jgi:solute:Na+ symporter, SSS family